MAASLGALLGTAIASIGARDQTAMARLAGAQGARPSALAIGVAMSIATAVLAAWAAWSIAAVLPASGSLPLAWLALGIAGTEMVALAPGPAPKEPTQSLAALAIVLAVHQLTDAARLLIFALTLVTAGPLATGVGGGVGGAIAISAAWLLPGFFGNQALRHWRRIAGATLLAIAAVQLLRV